MKWRAVHRHTVCVFSYLHSASSCSEATEWWAGWGSRDCITAQSGLRLRKERNKREPGVMLNSAPGGPSVRCDDHPSSSNLLSFLLSDSVLAALSPVCRGSSLFTPDTYSLQHIQHEQRGPCSTEKPRPLCLLVKQAFIIPSNRCNGQMIHFFKFFNQPRDFSCLTEPLNRC